MQNEGAAAVPGCTLIQDGASGFSRYKTGGLSIQESEAVALLRLVGTAARFLMGFAAGAARFREAAVTSFSPAPALAREKGSPVCLSIADLSGGEESGAGVTVRPEPAGEESVGSLYRKYAPSLFWVCKRYTRNSEDAEDMVQQVFVKVQQNLAGFRSRSGIYTWMYRIAVNECIQMFRKRKFESDEVPAFEEAIPLFPEKALDAKLVLEKIMGNSDPQTVEILFLLYLEGMKQEEAAEMLKISRTTLNRKITAFKSKMERFQW